MASCSSAWFNAVETGGLSPRQARLLGLSAGHIYAEMIASTGETERSLEGICSGPGGASGGRAARVAEPADRVVTRL